MTGALALAVAVAVVYLCTHYAFVLWTVAAFAGGSTLLGCVRHGSRSSQAVTEVP